jgi:hypothetical protein
MIKTRVEFVMGEIKEELPGSTDSIWSNQSREIKKGGGYRVV